MQQPTDGEPPDPGSVTRVANALSLPGRPSSPGSPGGVPTDSELVPILNALRIKARAARRGDRAGAAFDTTELVHMTLLKLGQFSGGEGWDNRGHFFAAAANAMRQILIDESRRSRAAARRETVYARLRDSRSIPVDREAFNEALAALHAAEPALGDLALFRFWTGLNYQQIADLRGCSERTVKRDWAEARRRLLKWLLERGHIEPGANLPGAELPGAGDAADD